MLEKENAALAAGVRLLYEKYLERHGLTANVIVTIESESRTPNELCDMAQQIS